MDFFGFGTRWLVTFARAPSVEQQPDGLQWTGRGAEFEGVVESLRSSNSTRDAITLVFVKQQTVINFKHLVSLS